MRRTDKEIKDQKLIEKVLEEALVCRVGLIDKEGRPYIVPMNYGYKDRFIYLHSASEGRKIDILKRNGQVCIEIEYKTELLRAEKPCHYGMKYYSIIGWGKAKLVTDYQEKIKSMDIIMKKHSPQMEIKYEKKQINLLTIIQIEMDELTGKMSGY